MTFKKSFPRQTDKTVYPKWEEVELSDAEEFKAEQEARHYNNELMKECIDDAKKILLTKNLAKNDSEIVRTAVALFEKRASHQVWWKEKAAKEKFDSQT